MTVPSRIPTAEVKASGWLAFIPNRHDWRSFDAAKSRRQTDCHAQCPKHQYMAQNHPQRNGTLRAERHANTDLSCAPGRAVRRGSI
jgi:hypothetical protein